MTAQSSGPDARAALETLIGRYERTVEQLILWYGPPRGACVEDLRQDFFTAFVRCEDVRKLDRREGKFRTWLHVAVRRFVGKRRRAWLRENPMDGVSSPREHDAVEHADPETGDVALHIVDPDTAERAFTRRFAEETLKHAIDRHRAKASNKRNFDRLLRFLPGPAMSLDDLDAAAAELGMTVQTLTVRICQHRREHRRVLRDLIADTLDVDPSVPEGARAVDQEMAELHATLCELPQFKPYRPQRFSRTRPKEVPVGTEP